MTSDAETVFDGRQAEVPFEIESDICEFETTMNGYIRSRIVGLEYADEDKTEFRLKYNTPDGTRTTDQTFDKPHSWDSSSNLAVRIAEFNDISKDQFGDILGAEVHIKQEHNGEWTLKNYYDATDVSYENDINEDRVVVFMTIIFLLVMLVYFLF